MSNTLQYHPIYSVFLLNCRFGFKNHHSQLCCHTQSMAYTTWAIVEWEIKEEPWAILKGTHKLIPLSTKCPKWAPLSIHILEKFHAVININDPRDVAIFTCMVTSFFCIACFGEFTIPAIFKYNPTRYIAHSSYTLTMNHQGLPVMHFMLPITRTALNSEETHCALQEPTSCVDLKVAINTHFQINPVLQAAHLFSWKHQSGIMCPLSKKDVTAWINAIKKENPNLSNLKGHSLHIEGMLHYFLLEVPFNIIKTMSRWSGESFTIYLQHHALVWVPFPQHCPNLMENLCNYILPPVR